MKNWFNALFVKGIFTSKKFIYAISSVIIPLIMTNLGVDETTGNFVHIDIDKTKKSPKLWVY